MRLFRRQKLLIAALAIYWPMMFLSTHIRQLPNIVSQVPLSDKVFHFFMYFILSFLLWFTINPNKRVSWRKPLVWLILAGIVWYGAIDEWLQSYVGRHADVWDFVADICGAVTGLLILTYVAFWPACLVLMWSAIFVGTNIIRKNPSLFDSEINIVFYLCSYGFLTLLWLRYIHNFFSIKPPERKWLLLAFSLPVGLLCVLEIFGLIAGHASKIMPPLAAIAAIAIVIFAALLNERLRVKLSASSDALIESELT